LALYAQPVYPSSTPGMSSSAFHSQITDLVGHLLRCRQVCDTIAANRRISREHGHLDNLRAGLKTCSNSVWFEFTALRNVVGSRMDLGDETARHDLGRCLRELESDVEARLRDIAARRASGPPAFKDILRKVERIEERIKTAMVDLGQRIRSPPVVKKAPVVTKTTFLVPAVPHRPVKAKPKSILKKADRAMASPKEVDKLRDHLMHSWEERLVGNTIVYVNCYDETKTRWVKPDGYIKPLSKPVAIPVRAPLWEQSVPNMALVRRHPMSGYRIV
jgi:hypothetical protein